MSLEGSAVVLLMLWLELATESDIVEDGCVPTFSFLGFRASMAAVFLVEVGLKGVPFDRPPIGGSFGNDCEINSYPEEAILTPYSSDQQKRCFRA